MRRTLPIKDLYLYKANPDGAIRLFKYENALTRITDWDKQEIIREGYNTVMISRGQAVVYRNRLWLPERDDEKAKDIFRKYWSEKAEEYAKATANCIEKAAKVEVIDNEDYTKVHKVGD